MKLMDFKKKKSFYYAPTNTNLSLITLQVKLHHMRLRLRRFGLGIVWGSCAGSSER